MHCYVCNISCRDKYSFQKHCKSAKHLTNSNEQIDVFDCECGKKYQYRQSMKFHQKTCKEYLKAVSTPKNDTNDLSTLDKKQLIERINQLEIDTKMQKLESENLKQKLKIAELEKKITHTTYNNTTNNNNNTTNNITNNITINAFGKENLDYITNEILIKCVWEGYNGIPFLIKKIHDDPNHPENHNIKIRDKRLNEIDIMGSNGIWVKKDRKETITQAVYDASLTIREAYDDNKELFPKSKQERFEEYNQKLNDENDNRKLKNVVRETDMVILGFKKNRVKDVNPLIQ